MKVVAIILAVVLIVFCFGVAIHFNQNVLQTRKVLESERYTRLTAEENLEKAMAEIRNLERELTQAQSKIKNSEKVLEQTKSINMELQSRMEEAAILQKTLQKKIEELEPAGNAQSGSTADAS